MGYGTAIPYTHRKHERTVLWDGGLGVNQFHTLTESQCRNHMATLGWKLIDIYVLNDIFCAKGNKQEGKFLNVVNHTQACNGDSGGPIFTEFDLAELKHNQILSQITKTVQIGVASWVDKDCDLNVNAFTKIGPYLEYFKQKLDEEWPDDQLFDPIDEKIFPSLEQARLYLTHKDLIGQ